MSKKLMTAVFLGAALVVVCGASSASSQSLQDSLVIYAKAGRVNLIIGTVAIKRAGATAVEPLAVGDELEAGDLVATGAEARLEVLLSPGAYLRLADNSEFQMVSTNLDDVRVFLRRGSAVIAAIGGRDEACLIQAAMPSGTAIIEKRGNYRLNVSGKRSEFLVNAGETVIRPAEIKLKEGKRVAITSGVAEPVAKIDHPVPDALESWSAERADYLAKANQALNQQELTRAFGTLAAANARRGGYWVYLRELGYSVFVPYARGNGGSESVATTNGGFPVSSRPEVRGIGEEPASTVVPAGSRGRGGNTGTSTPGRP